MLWFWMQRVGTLALSVPVDIRMAIGFSTAKEDLELEQVYRVSTDIASTIDREMNSPIPVPSPRRASLAREPYDVSK